VVLTKLLSRYGPCFGVKKLALERIYQWLRRRDQMMRCLELLLWMLRKLVNTVSVRTEWLDVPIAVNTATAQSASVA